MECKTTAQCNMKQIFEIRLRIQTNIYMVIHQVRLHKVEFVLAMPMWFRHLRQFLTVETNYAFERLKQFEMTYTFIIIFTYK